MNFRDYYNRKKPIVFLDMDGVLCDFKTEITNAIGKRNYEEISEQDVDNFFDENDPLEFFANLPKFPYTDYLVRSVINKFGYYNICSRPLKHHADKTIEGKRIWIEKNLLDKPYKQFYTFNKEEYAMDENVPNILVDDWDYNINAWNEKGGIGIEWDAGRNSVVMLTNQLDKYSKI